MQLFQKIADWLETHWVAPAYAGWLLGGLSIFLFAAATNTMAGWLYVISGVIFALLAIAALLPGRSLRDVHITRRPIEPISVGDPIAIELDLQNVANRTKTLLQVWDMLPHVLGQPANAVVEVLPGRGTYRWVYHQPTQRRGVYRWHTVRLRTATPLGLFWHRRSQRVKATAIVYPTVLPLVQCPLLDEMGREVNAQVWNDYNPYGATEGLTRTLRPYRWGDPIRLVHWRTSARYGELRVRELEVFTGGQEVVVCLDSAIAWQPEDFEQAVIAAASLYFYALHHNLQVSLWTAGTGLLRGDHVVLETLAAVHAGEEAISGGSFSENQLPNLPLLWLSQNSHSLDTLPSGSRWVLWKATSGNGEDTRMNPSSPGLIIQPAESLQLQLQAAVVAVR